LAEALEDLGGAVEAVAAGVHFGQQGIEFVRDALLLAQWWQWDLPRLYYLLRNVWLGTTLARLCELVTL